jgi:hypothetical protein
MGGHRPPEPPNATVPGEIPTLVIILVGILSIGLMAAVTVLIILGKPINDLLLLVGAYIAPTITSLMATRKLSQVATAVRGTVSNLITDKAVLENQVAALGDEPATLPGHRRITDHTNPMPKVRRGENG